MRIAVVGAGAIGTWIAAASARAGHDVSLLSRSGPVERVTVTGSEDYAVSLRADATAAEAVVLTVKAHDQLSASGTVRGLLGDDTPVVVAQNGLPWWYFHGLAGPYEGRRVECLDPGGELSAAIPPARTLGMVVYMGASVVSPGTVAVRPEAGLAVGEPDGSDSGRLARVASALEDAGFPVRRSRDIRTDVWTKLMGNATFNAISLLTRAGLGSIASHPGTRAIVAEGMAEIVAIARATGANPTISIEERLAITERLGDHKTSTLQDLEAAKRLELDAILAAPIELAQVTGVPAPTLESLFALSDLAALAHGVR